MTGDFGLSRRPSLFEICKSCELCLWRAEGEGFCADYKSCYYRFEFDRLAIGTIPRCLFDRLTVWGSKP